MTERLSCTDFRTDSECVACHGDWCQLQWTCLVERGRRGNGRVSNSISTRTTGGSYRAPGSSTERLC